MKKVINKLLMITAIFIICVILTPEKVQAGLQANKGGTSLVDTTASDFFALIKTMETGTVGLSTMNSSTDGIDCHMAKNTEWGTAAILASYADYGVVPDTTDSVTGSTTGNASGIFQMAGNKYEYTANYLSGGTRYITNMENAADKYKNVYQSTSTLFVGDAMNRGTNKGENLTSSGPVLARGYNNLWNYYGGPWQFSRCAGGVNLDSVGSRAAITCGTGL